MKLRIGDQVMVNTGKDRGTIGLVGRILKSKNYIWVDGVNKKTKHVKPQQKDQTGEKVDFFAPIHISNVSILDPKTKKPTRITYKREGNQKVRIARASQSVLPESRGSLPVVDTSGKDDKKTKTIKA